MEIILARASGQNKSSNVKSQLQAPKKKNVTNSTDTSITYSTALVSQTIVNAFILVNSKMVLDMAMEDCSTHIIYTITKVFFQEASSMERAKECSSLVESKTACLKMVIT